MQLQNSLQGLNQLQTKNPSCISKSSNKLSGCPQIVSQMMEMDRSDSSFGLFKSIYPVCQKYIEDTEKKQTFLTTKDLAQHFEKYQGASLGSSIHSQIRRCAQDNTKDAKEIVAKYYYNFSRIESSQLATVHEMTSLDQILGLEPLSDFDCKKISFESVQKVCDSAKKGCAKDPNGISESAAKTVGAKKEMSELETHKKSLQAKYDDLGARAKIGPIGQKLKDQMAALDFSASLIKSKFPWLSGSEYSKKLKSGSSEEDSIRAQLIENKKALSRKYAHAEIAKMCISGAMNRGCSPEKVRDFINETPIPPDILDLKMGDSRDKSIGGYDYLKSQQCVHDGTTDRLESASTFNHAFFDAGLGIATLGLGTLYTSSKLVVSARGVMIAKQARLADQAFNGTFLGASLAKATAECFLREKVLSDSKPESGQCKIQNVYKGSQALDKYDDCISGYVWSALDGTPFVFGGLQRWAQAAKNSDLADSLGAQAATQLTERGPADAAQRNILAGASRLNDRTDGGAARIAYAERLIGRKLKTEEERAWVLAAHNTNAGKGYKIGDRPDQELTEGELREKLRAAGGRPKSISLAETRMMIRGGALGGEGAAGRYADMDPAQRKALLERVSKMTPLEKAQYQNLPDRVRAELLKDKPDFEDARKTTVSSISQTFDKYHRASSTTEKTSYLNRIENEAALLGIQSRGSETLTAKAKEVYLYSLKMKMKDEVKGDPEKAKKWMQDYRDKKKASAATGVDGEVDRWAVQAIQESLDQTQKNPKDLVLDRGHVFYGSKVDEASKIAKTEIQESILRGQNVYTEPAAAVTSSSAVSAASSASTVPVVNPTASIKRSGMDSTDQMYQNRERQAQNFYEWSGGTPLTNTQSEFLYHKIKTYSEPSSFQAVADMRKLGFSDEQIRMLQLNGFEVGPNRKFVVKPILPEAKKKAWSNAESSDIFKGPDSLTAEQAKTLAARELKLPKYDESKVREGLQSKLDDIISQQSNVTSQLFSAKTPDEVLMKSEVRKAQAKLCKKILNVLKATGLSMNSNTLASYEVAVVSGNCSY